MALPISNLVQQRTPGQEEATISNTSKNYASTDSAISTLFSFFQLDMEKLDVTEKQAIIDKLKDRNKTTDNSLPGLVTKADSLLLAQDDPSPTTEIKISEDVNEMQGLLQTFFSIAVELNIHQLLRPLITKGAKVQDRDLLLAISQNHPDSLAVLLDNEVSANYAIHHQHENTTVSFPLIFIALLQEHASIVRLLLKRGADIEQQLGGMTPLHVATLKNNETIAALLLDEGASINAVTQEGDTALHIAAQKGYENIVRLLLQRRAKTTQKNRKGHTPDLLAFPTHPNITALILEHNAEEIDRKIQLIATNIKNSFWDALQYGLRRLIGLSFPLLERPRDF